MPPRRPARAGLLALALLLSAVVPQAFAGNDALAARHANQARYYAETHEIKPERTLVEIMAAAEKNDAGAQLELAEICQSHGDCASALKWFRRSVNQGNTNALYGLGAALLEGCKGTVVSTSVDPDVNEGVLWIGRSANYGFVKAQTRLGACYQYGVGVNQDFVEAYKWFALAAKQSQSNSTAKATADLLALRMSSDELATAKQRVDAFVPGESSDLPEPAYLSGLKLNGISGTGKNRLCIINNRTLAAHEETKIKLENKTVVVRCLEVHDTSVTIQAGPFRKELQLAD